MFFGCSSVVPAALWEDQAADVELKRKFHEGSGRMIRLAVSPLSFAQAEKKAAPKAEAADQQAPTDYEGLKVAEIADWTKGRHLPTLEAALAYEQAHGNRKGAIAALEAAIAKRTEGDS